MPLIILLLPVVALVAMVGTMWVLVRWAERKAEADAAGRPLQAETFAGEARDPRTVATTATCEICGKVDAKRPFIRGAISCYREDCAPTGV